MNHATNKIRDIEGKITIKPEDGRNILGFQEGGDVGGKNVNF